MNEYVVRGFRYAGDSHEIGVFEPDYDDDGQALLRNVSGSFKNADKHKKR